MRYVNQLEGHQWRCHHRGRLQWQWGLVLCGLLCGAGGQPARADVLAQGVYREGTRNQQLLSAWRQVRPEHVRRISALGGISARVHGLELVDGSLFIVRAPKRGNADGLIKGVALQRIAAQMGVPEVIPAQVNATAPFAIGKIPAGHPITVVEHAGPRFITADLDPHATLRVPEVLRQAGAVIDLLSEHTDRKRQNLLVEPASGDMRLIDPDGTFGAAVRKSLVYASVFYPGGSVAYQAPQNTIADLNSEVRVVVEAIANSSVDSIAQIYGLSRHYRDPASQDVLDQAKRLHQQAQSIVKLGLSAAIEGYLAGFTGRLRPRE